MHTTDIHSHLIPNLDDGSNSMEESIDALIQLKKLGFRKIITTPHIISHRFPNISSTIYKKYELLKNELVKQEIEIDLQVAAEYYYNKLLLDLIEKKDIMTFGDNYMLLELPSSVKPFSITQTISKIIDAGYKPILAHPERYPYFSSDTDYRLLKDTGVYFLILTKIMPFI
jgi:tyrosine-protein phosphatase YwqE